MSLSVNEGKIKDQRGTWPQALFEFFFPLFLVLVLRWALIEPFVIPSGSMIPSLLVHDHILVNKLGLGLKVPFVNKWIVRWGELRRGDIVVFKYPKEPDVHFVKRLVGLPGDKINLIGGKIAAINGEPVSVDTVDTESTELSMAEPFFNFEENYSYFKEWAGERSHWIRFLKSENSSEKTQEIIVPDGQYFFMGDNRDESSDSRVWGFVKEDYIVGRASVIWLSCEQTLPNSSFICDPSQLRFGRIGKWLQL